MTAPYSPHRKLKRIRSIQCMSPRGSRGKRLSSASSQELLRRPPFTNAPNRVFPLARLDFNMRDVYPASHWALQGTPPAYDTPDEDVHLHGRNVALLSKAAVYAAVRTISRIVVAPLAGNPFPDATPQFFSALNAALSIGLAAPIEVSAPFAHLHKEDVAKIGTALGVPLELTLSCMNPSGTMHCGLCSKCRERRDAFHAAGIKDPTIYANAQPTRVNCFTTEDTERTEFLQHPSWSAFSVTSVSSVVRIS